MLGYDVRLNPNAASKAWEDGDVAVAAELLNKLRPEHSKLDVSTDGGYRSLGVYFQVLPDEEYGDDPIYSIGGSVRTAEEPTRLKYGFAPSSFG